jgi:ABC-2 type transport system permease protein
VTLYSPQPVRSSSDPTLALSTRFSWPTSTASGLVALFWLSLRQYLRARRLFVLGFLFLLPGVLGVLVEIFAPVWHPGDFQNLAVYSAMPRPDVMFAGLIYTARLADRLRELEFALVFTLIPHTLLPLTALLFASGMIQDELEDQTLTYLLVRPLPKWTIYLVKLLAALLVSVALVAVFTALTYLAFSFRTPAFNLSFLAPRVASVIPAASLAVICYSAIFGFMSLLTRRTLVFGGAYLILIEGVLANIDFALRRLTVVYYFRVLVQRWSGQSAVLGEKWSIDLAKAPSALESISTLAVASALLVIGALALFSTREFRVKTPEGS